MLERSQYSSGTVGDYCLGLIRESYRGVEIIHHAGAVLGCNSQMLTVPAHDLDIIVIFNRMDCNASAMRSEEHTSELQSLMRISYAVFCLKKKSHNNILCIS